MSAPATSVCPACGAAVTSPDADRLRRVLWRLDTIAGQQRGLAFEADRLAQERGMLLAALGSRPGPPAAFVGVAPPRAAATRKEWRPDVVKNLLLWLGAGLVGVAALIFAIVAWSRLGAGGRAALLLGFTAIAAAAVVATRTPLPATSEALATLGLGLVLVDWYALRKTGAGNDLAGELWWAGGFALTALAGAGTGHRLKLAGTRLVAGLSAPFAGVLIVLAAANAGWTIGLGWAAVAAAATILACRLDLVAAWRGTAAALASAAVLTEVAAVWAIAIGFADRSDAGLAAAAPVAVALAATGLAALGALAFAPTRRIANCAGVLGVYAAAPAFAALAVLAAPGAPDTLALVVLAALGLGGLLGARLSGAGWFPLEARTEPQDAATAPATPLHRRPAIARPALRGATLVAAGCSAVAAAGITAHLFVVTAGPLRWLASPWQGRLSMPARDAVGLFSESDGRDGLFGNHPWVPLAVLATLAAIAVVGTSRRLRQPRLLPERLAVPLALGAAVLGVLVTPFAANASILVAWAVALGSALVLAAVGVQRHHTHARFARWFDAGALLCLIPAAGFALATPFATLSTIGLVGAAALAAATVLGCGWPRLVATGLAAVASGLGATAAVPAAGGTAALAGLAVSVASAAIVLVALVPQLRDGRDTVLDALGVLGLSLGSALAANSELWRPSTLTVAAVTFAAAGFVSARPGYQLRAALAAVLASWAWFARFDVTLLEAYSIPPALAAGAIGWSLRRRRPKFGSWAAYGVPLAVGFLPSVAAALEHGGPRSIVVVGFAVAAVVVGATRQLQAPLVVGTAALTVIAVQTLWPVALQVPRWVSIGGAGLLFLWLGATAERRLGQLRRLADRYESLG